MLKLNAPMDHPVVTATTTAGKVITDADVIARGVRKGVYLQPEGTVYVGGASVTSSTGIKLVADQVFFIELAQGQELYAITASGSVSVRVLPVF